MDGIAGKQQLIKHCECSFIIGLSEVVFKVLMKQEKKDRREKLSHITDNICFVVKIAAMHVGIIIWWGFSNVWFLLGAIEEENIYVHSVWRWIREIRPWSQSHSSSLQLAAEHMMLLKCTNHSRIINLWLPFSWSTSIYPHTYVAAATVLDDSNKLNCPCMNNGSNSTKKKSKPN